MRSDVRPRKYALSSTPVSFVQPGPPIISPPLPPSLPPFPDAASGSQATAWAPQRACCRRAEEQRRGRCGSRGRMTIVNLSALG